MSFLATATRLYHPELPLQPDLPPAQDTLAQKAAAYIQHNPSAVEALKELSLSYLRKGEHRGIKAIVEEYRYSANSKEDDSEYKWNNNYTSFVSRYLMATVQALRGYFPTRELARSKTRRIPARVR